MTGSAAEPDTGDDVLEVRVERTSLVVSSAAVTLSRAAIRRHGHNPDDLGLASARGVAAYITATGADAAADYEADASDDGITGLRLNG
jgi:hypothetical protein